MPRRQLHSTGGTPRIQSDHTSRRVASDSGMPTSIVDDIIGKIDNLQNSRNAAAAARTLGYGSPFADADGDLGAHGEETRSSFGMMISKDATKRMSAPIPPQNGTAQQFERVAYTISPDLHTTMSPLRSPTHPSAQATSTVNSSPLRGAQSPACSPVCMSSSPSHPGYSPSHPSYSPSHLAYSPNSRLAGFTPTSYSPTRSPHAISAGDVPVAHRRPAERCAPTLVTSTGGEYHSKTRTPASLSDALMPTNKSESIQHCAEAPPTQWSNAGEIQPRDTSASTPSDSEQTPPASGTCCIACGAPMSGGEDTCCPQCGCAQLGVKMVNRERNSNAPESEDKTIRADIRRGPGAEERLPIRNASDEVHRARVQLGLTGRGANVGRGLTDQQRRIEHEAVREQVESNRSAQPLDDESRKRGQALQRALSDLLVSVGLQSSELTNGGSLCESASLDMQRCWDCIAQHHSVCDEKCCSLNLFRVKANLLAKVGLTRFLEGRAPKSEHAQKIQLRRALKHIERELSAEMTKARDTRILLDMMFNGDENTWRNPCNRHQTNEGADSLSPLISHRSAQSSSFRRANNTASSKDRTFTRAPRQWSLQERSTVYASITGNTRGAGPSMQYRDRFERDSVATPTSETSDAPDTESNASEPPPQLTAAPAQTMTPLTVAMMNLELSRISIPPRLLRTIQSVIPKVFGIAIERPDLRYSARQLVAALAYAAMVVKQAPAVPPDGGSPPKRPRSMPSVDTNTATSLATTAGLPLAELKSIAADLADLAWDE